MKNRHFLLLIFLLLLTSCRKAEPVSVQQDFSNGPVVTEDSETTEEKITRMIQRCISDYNEDKIEETEKNLSTAIQPLPLEVTSIPQIKSLADLTEIPADSRSTNAAYIGQYQFHDQYTATFYIYHPNGGYFWLNGDVEFTVSPESIEKNNPQFEEYRLLLENLIPRARKIQNFLTGFDVVFEEDASIEGIYHKVLLMNDEAPLSISEMKSEAEQVFVLDYLEKNYYLNAFEGNRPIYKEIEGELYCLDSELTSSLDSQYDPSTIFYVVETEDAVQMNLLTTIMDTTLPYIKELTLIRTSGGYRLPYSL